MEKKKVIFYLLMLLLLAIWGFEYVVVKISMKKISPMELIFCRYFLASIIMIIIKLIRDRKFSLRKKDILIIITCSITGELLYFFGEYTALNYLKISTVTIFLALVPVISMIIELFVFKKKPSFVMVLMSFLCIIGIVFVMGGEISSILSGNLIGFVFIFLAVISWNCYNFLTEKLTDNYKPFDLTLYQLTCTTIICFPFFISQKKDWEVFLDTKVILGILFLTIFSSIICFLIYIYALEVLGSTSCAMFSNFLPISASIFGFLVLSEKLTLVQILAGCLVIISGLIFIRSKENLTKSL